MTTGKTTLWPHLHNPAPPPHQTRSTACKKAQLQFTQLNTRQNTGPFKRTYHTSNTLVLLTESLLYKIIVNHNTVLKKLTKIQNLSPTLFLILHILPEHFLFLIMWLWRNSDGAKLDLIPYWHYIYLALSTSVLLSDIIAL